MIFTFTENRCGEISAHISITLSLFIERKNIYRYIDKDI